MAASAFSLNILTALWHLLQLIFVQRYCPQGRTHTRSSGYTGGKTADCWLEPGGAFLLLFGEPGQRLELGMASCHNRHAFGTPCGLERLGAQPLERLELAMSGSSF